jgi:hypothetical protein
MTTTDEIRRRYRDEVLAWADAQGGPRKANKLFKKHHAYYKSIRDLAEGQQAMLSLLNDAEIAVRVMAATHLLPYAPDLAVPVLERAEREGGIMSIDAKYTLISFHNGSLNLGW